MAHDTLATQFLTRVLEPFSEALGPEAIRQLASLRIDPDLQARVDYLAGRANEGELTADERAEYLSYIEASDLLAILQLKAQRRLDASRLK